MDELGGIGARGGFANYKGVMLCSRPEERQELVKERPFYSRVDPKDAIGLNPTKKEKPALEKKPPNMALVKHKRW